MVKFDTIYSKLSYSLSIVQYFAVKNSYYDTFFPKVKHSLATIVNLGFSAYRNQNQGRIYRRGHPGQTRIIAPPLYYFNK